MSLVAFHRFLIGAAILFCAGYGVYELLGWQEGGTASVVLGVVFLLLAVLLAVYLWRLNRFLGYDEGKQ